MTTAAYNQIIDALFGVSPYAGFAGPVGDPAPPGWGQNSPVFERLICEIRPRLIVEVGSWLGASAIRMAHHLGEQGISGTIVCVDTWLGSPVHWRTAEYRGELRIMNGYPQLYYAFLANVMAAGHAGTILPLPQPSDNAARLLEELKLQAQLVYIDADHEATSVYNDLTNYWPLVAPGGTMFGDDFIADWPGVVRAVQMFAAKLGVQPEIDGNKWIIRKGGGG